MSSADVRDMLDLPAAAAGHPRPAKKQKVIEKRPDGISRELYSLMGDNAAGVQLREPLKYKEKPKLSKKPRTWDMTPFKNPSRSDGLVLKHWKMTSDRTPEETKKKGPLERPEPTVEEDYMFKKFNVKVMVPEYSDEQYEEYLKADTWTKEETDYLMSLCLDYNLRWIIIADRYEYQPAAIPSTDAEGDTALISVPSRRTMEDLKSRYYTIAARCLAISRPPANMTTAEFDLYEKMRKFDPVRETTRKTIADSLMRRTVEEVNEEKFLLSELQRIVTNEEILLSERRELYARLDAPQSSGNVSQYHNSQGISQLMQTLLTADKNKKRRSLLPGEGGGMSSPATAHANSHLPTRGDQDGGPKQKQPSISQAPATRHLSAADQQRYGVSHPPDRLTSGVQFRSDRAIKLTQAKSQVQTVKLQAALTELGLPARLTMPTEKVVGMFERLVAGLQTLLEVRKVSERVEGEVKVLEAMVEEREKKARGETSGDKGKDKAGDGSEDVEMANGADESVDQGNEEGEEKEGDVKMEDADGDDDAVNGEAEEGDSVANESGEEEAVADDSADESGDEESGEESGYAGNELQQIDVEEDEQDEGQEENEDEGVESAVDLDDHDQEDDDQAEAEESAEEENEEEDGNDNDEDANGEESQGEAQDQEEEEVEEEQEPALDPDKGPVAATARQHKRSASVLSGGSRGSVKRSRK